MVSSWVTNIGKERVEKAKIAIHNHFKNNFINNDLLSPRDSVYLSGKIVMNETMLYQDDDLLVINEGTTLELKNSANIIIKGGLQINGTKINPVIIKNIDSTNSSIIILQSPDTVKINFTKFFNLSSLSYDNWINTASLTFYNSNVIIKNSEFFNNSKGDDFVNIVSTNSFIIDNCYFSNVISDAIDIDFSNGAISNSRFEYCGNDAIDVSGSEIIIYNCKVANCNDKAISCGEASSVTINECDIKNSKYGIVSKDLSNVRSNNSAFHNNNYDFSVYQKKAEYGIASLIEKNSIGATKALISSTSQFFSNNNKIAVIINDSLINTLNQ